VGTQPWRPKYVSVVSGASAASINFRPALFAALTTESYITQEEAVKREKQLKKWSHAKKQALIDGDINQLKQLAKSHYKQKQF